MNKNKALYTAILIGLAITAGIIYFSRPASRPTPSEGVKEQPEHADQNNVVNWYNYDDGIKRAGIEGKKILISFYADWCYYCKLMEKTSFKDASVVSYLNENFIAIRVDTEKEKQLAIDYTITGLPANWFLEASGEKIGLKKGYLTPKILLQDLKFIYDEHYKSKK